MEYFFEPGGESLNRIHLNQKVDCELRITFKETIATAHIENRSKLFYWIDSQDIKFQR